MSMTTVAARVPAVVLARVPADLRARPRISRSQLRLLWRRISFWPAEFVRLVALVYMLPIAIYALGTPIAVAVNAVLFCTGWSWKALWQ